MSPLDHKMLRDLWHIKTQALAIAMVMGVGVMMIVMMTGLVASLTETRDAYYERYRLADAFGPVARAPEHLAEQIAQIDGVSKVQTRVVGRALIDVPRQVLPVHAIAVSVPDRGAPALNDIYLTDGRMPRVGHSDEIVLLQSFAAAHNLRAGSVLHATMNGAHRTFDIVGLAQSPEFLYTTAPGELVPDDARFGVIWMSRSSLSAAYDMDGAFNEVLLGLTRTARLEAVLESLDQLLDPFGGTGAYGLEEQLSNRFISEEIDGLVVSATNVPPIFLAIAAFLLYIVVGRIIQAEREEIGLMKAFGYGNVEVGGHYFKLIIAIAGGGAFIGSAAGIILGRALIHIYIDYFKFPFLVFRLDPAAFVTGVTVSIFAASVGGLFVLRRVFALTPADAMRPPAPADYSRSVHIGRRLGRLLDQPSRMVARRVLRQPVRMLGSMIGIACGMALTLSMITIYAGFDRTIDLTFNVVDRSDVLVSFNKPVSDRALFELARLDGVQDVEPLQSIPVVLRNGRYSHRGSVTGLPRAQELNRALDSDVNVIALPESGIVLSSALADILHIGVGQTLTVDVRSGRQPTLFVPVSGIAQTLLGSPAYMDLDALNRVLRTPRQVAGAFMAIDANHSDGIFAALQDMPSVAGVSLKSEALNAFIKIMNTGAGSVRYVMGAVAFIITFGIVYNAARIALAERGRDLASLRVIGFTKNEAGYVLLGELAVVTLVAIPLGGVIGHYVSYAIAAGFSTELYQIPVVFDPPSFGKSMLVVLGAALVSGWLVKRDLDHMDIIEVLKTRE